MTKKLSALPESERELARQKKSEENRRYYQAKKELLKGGKHLIAEPVRPAAPRVFNSAMGFPAALADRSIAFPEAA